MNTFEPVRSLIGRAVADHVCPAASIEVGTVERVTWADSAGALTYEPGAASTSLQTVFDLASLTKVIATTTVAARLVDRGDLDVASAVQAWIPEWIGDGRRNTTVRDLLEHCSGLPAWAPLYRHCASHSDFRAAICTMPFAYAPRTASVYSDLGFMLLGWVLESSGNAPLDRLFAETLSQGEDWNRPSRLAYRPSPDLRLRIAPTRVDPWRGRLLVGEVDDDNAWGLGGVAGHAGLFGSVVDVGAFARCVLASLGQAPSGDSSLISPETWREFLRPSAVQGSSRVCGWDMMRPTSSCGTRMSAEAFGHTGFTGTSLWIDPARRLYVVLLTNRVHPTADSSDGIQRLRRDVHDAVINCLESASG